VADDLGQDHSACDQSYQFLWTAELSDGMIFLRPLHPGGAADHLAGEDDVMAKWLSGARSTLPTVQSYIASIQGALVYGRPTPRFWNL
jgi:hypothetical protein